MTDLSTDLTPSEPLERSTQLDDGAATSEAQPHKEADKAKPESRLDAIKRAAQEVEKDQPKVEEKANPEDKPAAKAPEEKAVEEAPEPEKKPEVEAKPRRQPIEPPSKFLPRAKELWPNTPHEVRSEMQRILSESETETAQAKESVREYEAIRPYADMAKQSGTTIDQALGRYVQMEQSLRSDPVQGFRALLSNMQINPQQAIGHICAAFNVSPERLAQHMAQSPNEYTALAQPQQRPQQQGSNEVDGLKQQMAELQQRMMTSQVQTTIIGPFAAQNPRYHELEGTIAQFLQSDMIPKTLSPNDRLAAAYDMAVRISPQVKAASSQEVEEGEKSRAGEDFGGSKSVRGAPATGVDTSSRRRGKMSRGEALNAAMSELGIAH